MLTSKLRCALLLSLTTAKVAAELPGARPVRPGADIGSPAALISTARHRWSDVVGPRLQVKGDVTSGPRSVSLNVTLTSVGVGKVTSGSVGSLNTQSTKLLPVPNSDTRKWAETVVDPEPAAGSALRRIRANA